MPQERPTFPRILPALLLLACAGCSPYQTFDSVAHLRAEYAEWMGDEVAAEVEVPFELDSEIREWLAQQSRPSARERRRVESIAEAIFASLGLKYALAPTRNAQETFRTRQGNCLSFVNLFVGLAREQRLNAYYVEVSDAQSWSHRDGMVVSQGHVVAGVTVEGEMRTYDFLPYRTTAYRKLRPLGDREAAAHYFNNLGAEALLEGDAQRGLALFVTATRIAPELDKALNNLGVALARKGRLEEALAAYDRGLALDPDNVPLLSNRARALHQLGRGEEAAALMARLEGLRETNPFFLIYQADLALGRDQPEMALEHLARALRQDSEIAEVHVALVRAYLHTGDTLRARHHLQRALRLDATNREARYLAAIMGHGKT
jgi:tetratricopeptide (TPR) repeat protein